MANVPKVLVKRETLVNDLEQVLTRWEEEIVAYRALQEKVAKAREELEIKQKAWDETVKSKVLLSGDQSKLSVTRHDYTIYVSLPARVIDQEVGPRPSERDLSYDEIMQFHDRPKALDYTRDGKVHATNLEILKSAIWVLKNCADEYVPQHLYANAINLMF